MKLSLKILLRKLLRNKQTTIINLLGLSIGIVSSFVILLYIMFELSFDRFHTNQKNIYRITETRTLTEKPRYFAVTPPPVAGIISDAHPEVISTRLLPYEVNIFTDKEEEFKESKFYFTENSLFTIFSFRFIEGNKEYALSKPGSVVITESTAHKYFGSSSALGRTLKLNNKLNFTITGVVADLPQNSHIKIDLLASLNTFFSEEKLMNSWWETSFYSYVYLPDHLNNNDFVASVPELIEDKLSHGKGDRTFSLQALNKIHLHSDYENELEKNGNINTIYLFGIIGVLLILLACFNFMNITTATSIKVSKEIGLRKIFGAKKSNLTSLFLGEPVVLSIFSLAIAILIIETGVHLLDHYFTGIKQYYHNNRISIYILYLALSIFTGNIAGSYPALYLPRLNPILAIKRLNFAGKRTETTRNVIIALQFVIAAVMISASYMVYKQSKHLQELDLGYDKENMLVFELPKENSNQYQVIKNQLMQHNEIAYVSASGGVPGAAVPSEFPYQLDNVNYNGNLPNILTFMIDYDFIDTYGIKMLKGRNFHNNSESDKNSSFIINEKAAETFGWDDPIGKSFTLHQFNGKQMEVKRGEIIGVVQDFYYKSLNKTIEPLVMQIAPANMFLNSISIRYAENTDKQTLNLAKTELTKLTGNSSLEFFFLNDKLQASLSQQKNVERLLYIFTILVCILAGLGLFGLVAYNLIQRSKEIGIRKVLGSKVIQIIILFYKQYFKLIIYSSLVAIPISLFIINQWLSMFTYTASFNFELLFLPVLLLVLLTFLTITGVTIRHARMNPVKTLRYE